MQAKIKRLKPVESGTVPADEPAPLTSPFPARYRVLNEELDHLPIAEVYPRLVAKLQTDLIRAGEATLRTLIAEAPEDLRLAGYIYAVAIEDYEKVNAGFEKIFGGWTVQARAAIADLKRGKQWEGGAYTQDVERWIAANVPEFEQVKGTLARAARIRDAARRLFEAYESRLGSLQTYARLVEKRLGINVEQKHGARGSGNE